MVHCWCILGDGMSGKVFERYSGCTGANAMAISLARGRRVTLSKVDAFADGVAVKQVLPQPAIKEDHTPVQLVHLAQLLCMSAC